MSTVRVNLLPREIKERERARRRMGLLAIAAVGYLLVFVALFFVLDARVNTAEDRLAEAEAERQRLRSEVSTLQEYAELAERHEATATTLRDVFFHEASYAGILQDVAAVMPTDAALTDIAVDTTAAGEAQEEDGEQAAAPESFGAIRGTGETLEGHAPGVERFMLEFEKIAAFFQVFVSSSTLDEEGIATFTFEAELGPEILTGRYVDGLPETLR